MKHTCFESFGRWSCNLNRKMSYMAEKNRKLEEEWNAFNQKIKNAQNGNSEKNE